MTSPDGIAAPAPFGRRDGAAAGRRISISVTLAVGIGLLVFAAVAVVLALSVAANLRNTFGLLSDKAELTVTLAESQLRSHLQPAVDQVSFVTRLIEGGRVDPSDRNAMALTMTGAMAAAPQIMGLTYVDRDFRVAGVARSPQGPIVSVSERIADPGVRHEIATSLVGQTGPFWGEVIYLDRPNTAVMNLRQAVGGGDAVDMLAASVSVRELSRFLTDMEEGIDGAVPFILYGRDRVLAHPNLAEGFPGLSHEEPLPDLFQTGDPVLAALWLQGEPAKVGTDTIDAVYVDLAGKEQIMVYREIDGFGPVPLILGVHFPVTDVNEELRRLALSGFVGLAVGLIAILAGVYMGRRIARPIIRLAEQASRIGQLEFGKVSALPGSVFTELDDQARAFNTMLAGLRWFETYVPRSLVKRLVAMQIDEGVHSVERELTVMFTDIAGFTSESEGMPAAETAAFLNAHFALLASCIEAEGGTIDKFIGDAVMAFWGAPDRQNDHADRACRAALAIAEAIRRDNGQRRAAGEPPVRLRIGIHSGAMVVGNIGAPGRMNYTIVGDAVNIGNRLEQLGKELDAAAEVSILISGATAGELGTAFAPASCGRFAVRGRHEDIEVFRLGSGLR
ncbi:MAG: adenylate/guanylate cyclase domain-containing protein [Alphaproteobacteria bacterium]